MPEKESRCREVWEADPPGAVPHVSSLLSHELLPQNTEAESLSVLGYISFKVQARQGLIKVRPTWVKHP